MDGEKQLFKITRAYGKDLNKGAHVYMGSFLLSMNMALIKIEDGILFG